MSIYIYIYIYIHGTFIGLDKYSKNLHIRTYDFASQPDYNLGQNSWDKSQNCTTSVFDSVPPAPPVSMLVESNAIRPSQH